MLFAVGRTKRTKEEPGLFTVYLHSFQPPASGLESRGLTPCLFVYPNQTEYFLLRIKITLARPPFPPWWPHMPPLTETTPYNRETWIDLAKWAASARGQEKDREIRRPPWRTSRTHPYTGPRGDANQTGRSDLGPNLPSWPSWPGRSSCSAAISSIVSWNLRVK